MNTTHSHPDEESLNAYLQNPDSEQLADISLHLASCSLCREQVETVARLKAGASSLQSSICNDQQQQRVDDFLANQLSGTNNESLKQEITNNPVMLKSALFSLSQQSEQLDLGAQNLHPFRGISPVKLITKLTDKLTDWLKVKPADWFVFPLSAIAALLLVVIGFQNMALISEPDTAITISSFQDNNNIRYIPHNNMPGIGFFSSANQQSEPYKNMTLTFGDDNNLELEWQAVDNAGLYNLSIHRYAEGKKQLHDKLITKQTRASIQIAEADFNQRFEWVLSGKTSELKSFITSGGFVINRKHNL